MMFAKKTVFAAALTLFVGIANAATTAFVYTGAEQQWVVPAGVTQVTIESWGASVSV